MIRLICGAIALCGVSLVDVPLIHAQRPQQGNQYGAGRPYDPHARDRADTAASRLERSTLELVQEIYRHRDHHDFADAYREAREMWAVARHVHELMHHDLGRSRIRRNVQDLDEIFHHLETHIEDWNLGYQLRPNADWHAFVFRTYNPENRLLRLMAVVERDLHRLMEQSNIRPRSWNERDRRSSRSDFDAEPPAPPRR